MRALVVLLVCLLALLAYRAVDQAVSLDHSRASAREMADERGVLRAVVLELGRGASRDTVKQALATSAGSHLIKEDRESLSVLGLVFRFGPAGLVAVDSGFESTPVDARKPIRMR